MRGATVILVLVLGLVASVFVAREDESPPPPPDRFLPADSSLPPPVAHVARCGDSITVSGHDGIGADDSVDTVVGPLRIFGLGLYEQDWQALVDEDQWLKAAAMVDAGQRVTLEIPPAQRAWNELEWDGSSDAVTLRACADQPTIWIGGFTIDYANAPREGRCAALIVRGDGPAKRVRLFDDLC